MALSVPTIAADSQVAKSALRSLFWTCQLIMSSIIATLSKDALAQPTSGGVVWMTGLSGAGKTTLADSLRSAIASRVQYACILDGDEIRGGVNSDLSFSAVDRMENIRRIGEISALLARQGAICIVAAISPFEVSRQRARRTVEPSPFIEVFVDTPLEVCVARDTKNLYQRAQSGEERNVTGISSPYERPIDPDLVLDTTKATVSECTAVLVAFLTKAALIRD